MADGARCEGLEMSDLVRRALMQAAKRRAQASDQYFNNVVLSMHMDDAGLTDVKGHAISLGGNAARSGVQSKFGTYSAIFDGNGDWLETPNHVDFNLGSGNLTVEGWVYISGNSSPDVDGSRGASLVNTWTSSGPLGGYILSVTGNTTTTGTGIGFDTWSGSGNGTLWRCPTTISQNQWHHIAAVVNSGVRKCFLNGNEVSGSTITVGAGYTSFNNFSSALRVGGRGNYPNYPLDFNGYIDDVRITKGVARYTANFLIPTTPSPDS